MRYSTDAKRTVMEKLLRPDGPRVSEISAEFGIPAATLYKWISSARNGTMKRGRRPDEWNLRERYAAVLEARAQGDEALGRWVREKGLHVAQLERWETEISAALVELDQKDPKAEQRRVNELEKEIRRKDKALAEMSALIVLKKKLSAILGEDED